MILLKQSDILHKVQLLKLLIAIVDDPDISQSVYFKGGTCATMGGYLDRFSVDLDFDLKKDANKGVLEKKLGDIFKKLDLINENKNTKTLFYLLKYSAPKNQRNTLKLSFYEDLVLSNIYKPLHLSEIDRIVNCQSIETMFGNKLVAPIDRYNKHAKIAGRDIYDIHYFFSQGYKFRSDVIEERSGMKTKEYIQKLFDFIEKEITGTILTQDLNTLLPTEKFQRIRKTLKQETLLFLKSYINS